MASSLPLPLRWLVSCLIIMSLSPAPVPTNTVYSTNWLDINPADMLKKVKEVLYAVERFSAYRRETSSIKQKNAAFSMILCTCSSKLWLLELLLNLKEIVNTYAADPVSAPYSTSCMRCT